MADLRVRLRRWLNADTFAGMYASWAVVFDPFHDWFGRFLGFVALAVFFGRASMGRPSHGPESSCHTHGGQ